MTLWHNRNVFTVQFSRCQRDKVAIRTWCVWSQIVKQSERTSPSLLVAAILIYFLWTSCACEYYNICERHISRCIGSYCVAAAVWCWPISGMSTVSLLYFYITVTNCCFVKRHIFVLLTDVYSCMLAIIYRVAHKNVLNFGPEL